MFDWLRRAFTEDLFADDFARRLAALTRDQRLWLETRINEVGEQRGLEWTREPVRARLRRELLPAVPPPGPPAPPPEPAAPLPPDAQVGMPCPACKEGRLVGEQLGLPPTGGDYEWVDGDVSLRCTACRALFRGNGRVWL